MKKIINIIQNKKIEKYTYNLNIYRKSDISIYSKNLYGSLTCELN